MRLGDGQGAGRRAAAHRVRRAAWLCAVLAPVIAPAAAAAQVAGATRPGTIIANTAELRWTIGERAGSATSNTDRLIVAERLDVALATGPTGSGPGALPVVLTNTGSGDEAFAVAATPPDDPARVLPVVVDVDGDGRCDPGIDRALADGRTPVLAAGASVRLLVCADGPARAVVRAVTGSGTPGTVFAGAGDGGGDAVVGATGAAATLLVGTADGGGPAGTAPQFEKSQTVIATDGSARAAAGSVITYTLAARFPAAAAAAEIEDALPAGTAFVAGSLALDDTPLSDAADGDAGELSGGTVRVRLGDVAAGTAHRVTFAVTVTP